MLRAAELHFTRTTPIILNIYILIFSTTVVIFVLYIFIISCSCLGAGGTSDYYIQEHEKNVRIHCVFGIHTRVTDKF